MVLLSEAPSPGFDPGLKGAFPGPRSALLLHVTGVVQGVGFRPFVYRLARRFELQGWVRNSAGDVEIALGSGGRCGQSGRRQQRHYPSQLLHTFIPSFSTIP